MEMVRPGDAIGTCLPIQSLFLILHFVLVKSDHATEIKVLHRFLTLSTPLSQLAASAR